MFTNHKRRVALLAFAAAVATSAACNAGVTAPKAPVKALELKQRVNLDTAELCPYGWMIVNGVVVCNDPGR